MIPDRQPRWSLDDERYELLRKLGSGGSGAVYLVRDRETGEQLALKHLHRADDRSITRLKQEFRSLTNINHRNVIRLYTLGHARDVWFITMEYIAGTDLAGYLFASNDVSATVTRGDAASLTVTRDVTRIVATFHQLACGVKALHRAHVLHRDLKPSNVLVENDRVVVVDFGLALDVGDQAATLTLNGLVAGTPAYMAPEQVQGRDWGEPNDWYAFGVMLYEMLSGQLPIDGNVQTVLRRKLELDPTPLDQLVSGLPTQLTRLCMGLLDRQLERRPSGDEVLAVLQACLAADGGDAAKPPAPARALTQLPVADPAFVGREPERAQLRLAFSDVMAGGFAAVHVRGLSGAGKSALVERFVAELEQSEQPAESGPPLVLRSRCYERETVPFKALDAAIDALITQLDREDQIVVSHALPRDIGALTLLFPALTRLAVVQRLVPSQPRRAAAPHTREQAETALRDLFARLCSLRPVVLWLDDLHWGDLDSARILRGWMEPPGISGLLLILSYRSDELAVSPCLRHLAGGADERVITIGPLDDAHIRALCRQRWAAALGRVSLSDVLVERVVGEAAGSPFLASQLAALASSEQAAGDDGSGQLSVEALVARRTAQLSTPARRVLNVLAVASRPLSSKLALRLAAATESSRAVLHELSGLGLIRSSEGAGQGDRLLAVYHDRLREGVLASLAAAERGELDRQLLHALEAEGCSDYAWLHALARSAGDAETALRYGLQAAAHAQETLAFEQAAHLYRACIQLCPPAAAESRELREKLAVALAHSGHGRQAAAAYLEAARYAEGLPALQLERRAASHLLRSGSFEEGEALVHKVLRALHLETPTSTLGLIFAIVVERCWIALRGLRFTPRSLDATPFAVRYRGELCGTLSIELQSYDPLRAALFQARSLRMALGAGVPELLARALCAAATMASVTAGKRGPQRAAALLARAEQLAEGLASPLVESNIHSARAVCAMLQGRLRDVLEPSEQAERMFRQVNAADEGEYYHHLTVLAARVTALSQLGQHALARSELQRAVSEARATDNVGALLLLSGLRTRLDLMDGQVERSITRLELEREQLPAQRFGLLHVYYLCSVMRVGCLTGDYDWTQRFMRDDMARFRRSLFRRGSYFAVIVPALHARLLLNRCVARNVSAAEAAKQVATDIRVLRGARVQSKDGALARTAARLALLAGDRAAARPQLEASIRGFERYEIASDEAARDRYALGALIGGSEGAALQTTALTTLRDYGYADPLADLAGYYPELLPAARAPSV
ncbi:MAG: protein kinase [Polyangiales bacterium]